MDRRTILEYGRTAYEGYYAHSGGKSLVNGDHLPMWQDLSNHIQLAWGEAARQVALRTHRRVKRGGDRTMTDFREHILGVEQGITGPTHNDRDAG